MTRWPGTKRRSGEIGMALACALIGLSVAGIRALADPDSRLSRRVDGTVRAIGPR